jgi:hypothetical protein
MHEDCKALLKQGVQKCLPILQPLVEKYLAPHQVWKKTGEGQWHGEVALRSEMQLFIAADKEIGEIGEPFAELFFSYYPEYDGMVGFPGFGLINLGHDRNGAAFIRTRNSVVDPNFDDGGNMLQWGRVPTNAESHSETI